MAEDLWKRVEAAFWYVGTREKAIGEADRIFRKTYRDFPENYISEPTCTITFERLTRESIESLELRHTLNRPQFGTGTIVIVEHEGHRHVVDGTKRINRWKSQGITETDEGVVIARK
jgi:hypothetical protein